MKLQKKPVYDPHFLEMLDDLIYRGFFAKARRKLIRLVNHTKSAYPTEDYAVGTDWKTAFHKAHRPLRFYLRQWRVVDPSIYTKEKLPKYRIALKRTNRIVYGYQRLTFKYRTAYRDNDDTKYIGEFRVLKYGKVKETGEDSYQTILTVKTPKKNMNEELLYNVFSNTFNSSCACEYDCCGHVSSYVVDIKKVNSRVYHVSMSHTRNV